MEMGEIKRFYIMPEAPGLDLAIAGTVFLDPGTVTLTQHLLSQGNRPRVQVNRPPKICFLEAGKGRRALGPTSLVLVRPKPDQS